MRDGVSSRIMPRTTIDIDPAVMRDLRRRQRIEGKSLGRLVSELLAGALAGEPAPPSRFQWTTAPLGSRIDLEDKEAVRRAVGKP
jgi:hypothetical protein